MHAYIHTHIHTHAHTYIHFILYMHISLGGLFNICENGGGGGSAPPEKLWRILCFSIKCL